jgi:hypothetical protein
MKGMKNMEKSASNKRNPQDEGEVEVIETF